jgi:hypothetical protein
LESSYNSPKSVGHCQAGTALLASNVFPSAHAPEVLTFTLVATLLCAPCASAARITSRSGLFSSTISNFYATNVCGHQGLDGLAHYGSTHMRSNRPPLMVVITPPVETSQATSTTI